MLSLCRAAVALPHRQLLAPTDLEFKPGKLYGVVGHNGSGKSTMIKLLARQLAPSSGQVRLDGEDAKRCPTRDYARRVAYLPQHLPSVTHLAARELIAMGRYPWKGPLGRHTRKDSAAIERAIRLTDVEDMLWRSLDTLSGGERQRVWLAMLVAQESCHLLLDEPLAALDLSHQEQVMALIRALASESGLCVILSIHDINTAARYCDEIIALRGGTLIHRGPPSHIMRGDTLHQIFGIPMHLVRHPADQSIVAVL